MSHYLVKERIKASSTRLSFASCFCPVSKLDLSKGQGNALMLFNQRSNDIKWESLPPDGEQIIQKCTQL